MGQAYNGATLKCLLAALSVAALCLWGAILHLAAAEPPDPLPARLKGTVAIYATTFTCSGSLVSLRGQGGSAKALILTNGHCIGRGGVLGRYLGPGESLLNVGDKRAFSLHTGDVARPVASVHAEALVYATMT